MKARGLLATVVVVVVVAGLPVAIAAEPVCLDPVRLDEAGLRAVTIAETDLRAARQAKNRLEGGFWTDGTDPVFRLVPLQLSRPSRPSRPQELRTFSLETNPDEPTP